MTILLWGNSPTTQVLWKSFCATDVVHSVRQTSDQHGKRSLLFLGISGCPSSGKSTLAYLITITYPDSILLPADDFTKDTDVPMLPPPLNCLDSDSKFAVDFNTMYKVLNHRSWFRNNIMTIEEGQSRVRHTDAIDVEALLESLEHLLRDTGDASLASTEQQRRPRLITLDGFLLYHDPQIRKVGSHAVSTPLEGHYESKKIGEAGMG